MRIELESGGVRLRRNQSLKVRDGLGSTVCAVNGSVWITEQGQPDDIVLKPGSCYRLRRPGLAIVYPLGDEASVSFS